MTYRERKRHRRGRKHSRILLGLLVVGLCIGIGIASLAAYVISVGASAPPLDSLKPIEQGTSSAVYANDGTRLGFIQSDEIRTPISLRRKRPIWAGFSGTTIRPTSCGFPTGKA